METAIGQKSSRNDSRQIYPAYATGPLDASPLFERRRPSSTPVASKYPDLPTPTSPTLKRFVMDRKSMSRVNPNSSSRFHYNQKMSPTIPFTRLPRTYHFSHVKRQDQLADFKDSPPYCSCATLVEASAIHKVGKGLYYKREELPLSALPQGRICVSRRAGRDELSPQRRASTGPLTCVSRKQHCATQINVNLSNDIPGYGPFRSSPIPAQPEDVSPSWRMRLRTQVERRSSTYLDEAIRCPSSVWGEAAANLSGEQAERQHLSIDAVLDKDGECEPARLQADTLSRPHKSLTAPALCDMVSGWSRHKASTPKSSPRIVRCKMKVMSDAHAGCIRHLLGGSAASTNHSSGSSRVTSIDTSCDSIYRQCDFTGACCTNDNADSRNSSSTTGCSTRTTMVTGDSHTRTESGLLVSAAHLRVEAVRPLPFSRPSSVTGSARASSSPALRSTLSLNPSKAPPENSRKSAESSSSSQVASNAAGGSVTLTQGEKCEKSHVTDDLLRSANHLSTRSAIITEGVSDEMEEHSAVFQEGPQRSRHMKQCVAQQTEDAMPGSDTPAVHPRSRTFVDRDVVTGMDAHNKSARPLRTDRSNTTAGQSERLGARCLTKTGLADEVAPLPNNRAAQKKSPLVQPSKLVQSLLMPPPSPLHFFFPLHCRLPPQPLESSSPDENITCLDDEERKARPAQEFATVGSSIEDIPADLSRDRSSPTLIQSAVTDPDSALTCEGKEGSPDVGAPRSETASGNSGATTSAAADSASEERSSALSGDTSASQSKKSKILDTNNMFHSSGFDVKTPACLSFQRSFSEEDCNKLSRVPGLERPHPRHHSGLASGQPNGESASKRCPYLGAASEKVLHESNELGNDVHAGSADCSAARHLLTATALQPHSAGVLSYKTIEAIPATLDSETLPDLQTTTPLACLVSAAAQSKEESLRNLTPVRLRTQTPRTSQAATRVRGAKNDGEQIYSVVQSTKASLAEGLSVSSRSHLAEERPHCSNEPQSSLYLFSQQKLQKIRSLQNIHCVEALSLPVSFVSPCSTKHLQQKKSPERARVRDATAALTDPQLKRLVSITASSDFHGAKPTLKTPAGLIDKLSDARATAKSFLGERNRRRLFQRPSSAAGRCCDICRHKNTVCIGIGSPTGLLPKTPLSARRTIPETKEEKNIPVISVPWKTERCGCCGFRTSARSILNVCLTRLSPASDTAPSSSVAGYTLCPGAGCVSVRTRCHPDEVQPQTDGLQSFTETFEKNSLRPPRCSLPVAQTSSSEGICNGSIFTRRCEPSVSEDAANDCDTTFSTAERRRSLVTNFSRGRETLHAFATAFPTCATPNFVARASCTERQARETLGTVSERRVARTQTESLTAPHLSSSNKKCPSIVSTSSNTFLHKVVKRKLKQRRMMSDNWHVRIRPSIWQALRKSIISLAQSTSSPSVSPEQRPTAFALRSADSHSPRSLDTGELKSEQQAFHTRVDAVILREKPATRTDSLRCTTSKFPRYFGDGHRQTTKDLVDSSTSAPSSSSTGSDMRGGEVALGKQELEITSREGRKEQGILGGRSAYNVLRSAGGLMSTQQVDPCVTDKGWEGSLDSFPKMNSEGPDADAGRRRLKGRTTAGDNSHRGQKRRSPRKPQTSCTAVSIDEVPSVCSQQRDDTREEHCNRSCNRFSRRKHNGNHTGLWSKVRNCHFSRSPSTPAEELAAFPSLSLSWPQRRMSGSQPASHTGERLHTSVCCDTEGRGLRCAPVEPEIEYTAVRMQKAYITSKEGPLQKSNQTGEISAGVSKNGMLSVWPGATSHAVTNRHFNFGNGARSSESRTKEQVCLRVCNRAHFHGVTELESQKDFWSQPSFKPATAVTVVHGVEEDYLSNGIIVEGQHKFTHTHRSVLEERSFDSREGVKETVQHSTNAHGRCGVSTLRRMTGEHDFSSLSVQTSAHPGKYDKDDACSPPKVQLQQGSQSQAIRRRSRLSRSIRLKHNKRCSRLSRRRAASRACGKLQSECSSRSLVQHFSSVYGDYTSASGNKGPSQASCLPHAPSSRKRESNECDIRYYKGSDLHSSCCGSAELEDQCAAGAQDTGIYSGWHVASPFVQLMGQMLPAEDANNQNAEQQCATKHGEKLMTQKSTLMDCQKKHNSCSSELKRDSNKSRGVDQPTTMSHPSFAVQPHSHACHIDTPFHAPGEHEFRQSLILHPTVPCWVDVGAQSGRCAEAASEDVIAGVIFPPQRQTQITSPEAPPTLMKKRSFNQDHECRNDLKPSLVEALDAKRQSSTGSRADDEALSVAARGKSNERCVGADHALPVKSLRPKVDYCPPHPKRGPLVHATGIRRSSAEGVYLAVLHAGSPLESRSEPSTSSHTDSDHKGYVQKKDRCFTQNERNSHKAVPQEHDYFYFISLGKPLGPLHAKGHQPSMSGDVCTTSFPQCNYEGTGCEQTTAETAEGARLLESRRPSLSKMDMLIEKIILLRQAVKQKEDVSLLDAAAPRSSPAGCGDNASPLPSSIRSETSGLPSCMSGKCLTLQSTEGETSSEKLEQNEKQTCPKLRTISLRRRRETSVLPQLFPITAHRVCLPSEIKMSISNDVGTSQNESTDRCPPS